MSTEKKILDVICEFYGNDEFVEENLETFESLASFIAAKLSEEVAQ